MTLLNQFLPEFANHYLLDENTLVPKLVSGLKVQASERAAAKDLARQVTEAIRAQKPHSMDINQLLSAYQLTSEEGVALMCVAEALLRIPDVNTRNALIRDKMSRTHWEADGNPNPFQNFSTWALNLTGNVLNLRSTESGWGIFGQIIARLGQPVIRRALEQAMRIMGDQFVLGETIEKAIARRKSHPYPHVTASYDMLGEGARTMADAARYFAAYETAIHTVGKEKIGDSISIKLSALHPRYEWRKPDRIKNELYPSVLKLCQIAKTYDLMVTIDAEEMDRLTPSLELFEMLARAQELAGWNGLGLAVQAYGRRCLPVLDFLIALATDTKRRFPVRLVKGAYWDTEIKRAQVEGHEDYPVFTRKMNTDVSYFVAADKMLAAPTAIYPQFATHNAFTAAGIIQLAKRHGTPTVDQFEFQRLHGMGENLYENLSRVLGRPISYRIYAPVGPHHDLLAYLVRRLLENGANSSFVYQIADKETPLEKLLVPPVQQSEATANKHHPSIPFPPDIYGTERKNSFGPLLPEPIAREKLIAKMEKFLTKPYAAAPIINGKELSGTPKNKFDPSDPNRLIGTSIDCTAEDAARALEIAHQSYSDWDELGGAARAKILMRAADLFEEHIAQLVALIVREGGRTLISAINDFREAVDFLRYYGAQAEREFEIGKRLPGPTGEQNELWLRGRGVFVCIAPWNFPLAIFTGQVSAALAAGNAAIAKPAGQTPLVAHYAVKLLHQAGVPANVLHFTPGSGSALGKVFVESKYTGGIAFTGSTATANTIHRGLAARGAPIVPLIAETGGQNCMIVDSTALLEQACDDILTSAFDSAGQRCSALRVAYIQDDIADRLIEMLKGAAAEWQLGDPMNTATDVGPVIDTAARDGLLKHAARMQAEATIHFTAKLPDSPGSFFAPRIVELKNITQLTDEVFGPVLHIIRYKEKDFNVILGAINSTGFGLTVGVHSRLDHIHELVRKKIRAGNLYVNRTMIGAVVGVQPFGGEGLSGTGPKAGGPHYLHRFATERTVSINTTAAGGNASLLAMAGDDK